MRPELEFKTSEILVVTRYLMFYFDKYLNLGFGNYL